MYRLKYLNIFLILCLIIFVLLGCANEMKKETIHEGFPSEVSPATMELMKHLVSSHLHFLTEVEEQYIFSKQNLSAEDNEVKYFVLSKNELETFVKKYSSEKGKSIYLSIEEKNQLFDEVEPESGDFPEITIEKGNILFIKTEEAEKEFALASLLSQYDIQTTDEIRLNLVALNENEMQIDLRNPDKSMDVSLLIKNDLEHFLVAELFGEGLEEVVQSGELYPFKELFIPVNENGNLRKITLISNVIWDADTGELYRINDDDYLSDDGKFVYLGGKVDPLSEGKQRIQAVTDYVQENEEDYAQFSLDFKPLSEFLEEKSSGKVTIAKVVYFAEDYAVIYANFAGPYIGNAGATNIIVDLQEDKNNPTFYVVDLNLHL